MVTATLERVGSLSTTVTSPVKALNPPSWDPVTFEPVNSTFEPSARA